MVYVHVASGKVSINGEPLAGGDGATIAGEALVEIAGRDNAEVLLFDLPAQIQ